MPNISSITSVVAFRLSKGVIKILQRRVDRSKGRWSSISDYLKHLISRDALRKR